MSQENMEITRRANEVLARDCLCRVAIGCNRRHLFSVRSTTPRGGRFGYSGEGFGSCRDARALPHSSRGLRGRRRQQQREHDHDDEHHRNRNQARRRRRHDLHLDADPSGALKFIGPDGADLGTGAKNGLKAKAGRVTSRWPTRQPSPTRSRSRETASSNSAPRLARMAPPPSPRTSSPASTSSTVLSTATSRRA